MCVLYVSFGSKVRPIIFRCVAIGSAVLFILRSRLLLYSAGSGVNRVQVVLPGGFSVRIFFLHGPQNKQHYTTYGNRCSGWWYVCSINVEWC